MFNKLFSGVKNLFGTKYDRDVAQYAPVVEEINEYYEQYHALSHDELRQKTQQFRGRIQEHLAGVDEDIVALRQEANEVTDFDEKDRLFKELDDLTKERDQHLEDILKEILPEAFAVVKETARRFTENDALTVQTTNHDRELAGNIKKDYLKIDGDRTTWSTSWTAAGGAITWNMIHYDVQLIGGQVLHDGKIAEMQTGEGKTLVATLPAYLNGLSGLGVHVVTVNDYLARRDAEWIGPILEFLGLTIDCIDNYRPHSKGRIAAYQCDVVYGTNNEFGFDYLRDNMVRNQTDKVQGKHHFAMVDEVDSVLVDDARTPLIISGPVPKGTEEQEYENLKPLVERLVNAQKKLANDYLAEAKRLIGDGDLRVEEGGGGLALFRAFKALPKNRKLINFLSQEGMETLLRKPENHYMAEQNKHMPAAVEPLYFTIDEKNRQVELTDHGYEYLGKTMGDKELFIMPDLATEMVAIEDADNLDQDEKDKLQAELSQEYSSKARRIHATNQLVKAYTMFTREEEYVVMDGEVKIVDESTGRVMEGRRYSDGLHQALEAKENVKIGDITQTYATVTLQNYFRMYHKLAGMTGTAETEAGEFWEIYKLDVVVIPTNRPIQRADREDLVYKTEREKFDAVINEIDKLTAAGRPVLVGTTTVDNSEKLSAAMTARGISHNVLNAKQHQREAEIVSEAGRPGKVTIATNMAGRGTDIKLTDEVKKAGGLAIIATERHDSRRVDRQLRGRSGRQGDPGSSQFYVSLEDNLMRLFKSERIAKVMDRMGHQEGDVIQHSMVSKSIERAQKKVEENNFGIRKRLLEYDDVMNIQREAIYNRRNNALSGERLQVDLHSMFQSLARSLVEDFKEMDDFDAFRRESMSVLGVDPRFDADEFRSRDVEYLADEYHRQIREVYDRKAHALAEFLMPQIEDVYSNQGDRYKRIALPYTDGTRTLPVSADLKAAVDSRGETIMRDIEKAVTLAIIDENWKEHLRAMDDLKESSQAASFEQKDPLVVYKLEAYNLFENLIYRINEDVTSYLIKGTLVFQDGQTLEQAKQQRDKDLERAQVNRGGSGGVQAQRGRSTGTATQQAMQRAAAGAGQRQRVETMVREKPKVKRNDPCPCGSGKKYKHCHGRR